MQTPHKGIYGYLAIVLVITYFPIFLQLDRMPLVLYDEARMAVNALEMTQNGNLIVTHYGGIPETWQTKPPMLIWLQALCMKIIGYNETAVRLPSAIAAMGTVLILFFFAYRKLRQPFTAVAAPIILVTCDGYIDFHVARTGDYDSLLTFFTTAYLICFWIYTEVDTDYERRKWLTLTALCVACAALTKGIAGFLFLPAMVLYLFIRKQFRHTLSNRSTYTAMMIVVVLVGGYYALREYMQPGYLQAMYEIEIARYDQVIEAHQGHWDYYLQHLHRRLFMPWLYLLPFAIMIRWTNKELIKRSATAFTLFTLTYLLVISSSSTKLEWYTAPMLPLMSLLVGIGLYAIYELATHQFSMSRWGKIGILAIAMGCYLYGPYQRIWNKIYLQDKTSDFNWRSVLYRDFMKQLKNQDPYTIAYYGQNAHVAFQMMAYRLRGYEVHTRDARHMVVGEKVVLCEVEAKRLMDERYTHDTLRQWKACMLVKITGKKDIENK